MDVCYSFVVFFIAMLINRSTTVIYQRPPYQRRAVRSQSLGIWQLRQTRTKL